MVFYLLKSALLLTLLYGGFTAFLSRETFHRFNRVVLIAIVLCSLVLPALRITMQRPTPLALSQYWPSAIENRPLPPTASPSPVPQKPSPLIVEAEVVGGISPDTPTVSPAPAASPASASAPSSPLWQHQPRPIGLTGFLSMVYLAGLVAVLLRLAFQAVSLVRSLKGSLRCSDGQGNTIIIKGGELAPFSFMHYIVMSVGDYEHHRQPILTHEQAHARLGHSYDVALLLVAEALQWFNPFVWLLGRELRAIHEYEADEAVIKKGIDAKQYQQLLVMKAVGNRLQPFANTLNRGSLKQRINMMYQQKSSRWRMLRAAFIVPVAVMAMVAFAETPLPAIDGHSSAPMQNDKESTAKPRPLVEYRAGQKMGKRIYNAYVVNLGEGVWIEQDGKSFIEEQNFRWSFNDSRGQPVMQLNGVSFDQNSLPRLTSSDLKKIEIKKAEKTSVEGYAHGSDLKIEGGRMVVNLVTTPVAVPAGVEGNVPRVQTLLLPGKGQLYIKNGKATPGDWMHCSVTSWEPTSYGYSVRNELLLPKTKPGYKCYVYASTETSQKDISRAEALLKELGIDNYEVVGNLPKRHFSDAELRQWARDQKARGTAYGDLYDAMAPNHIDGADVHRQWHIVKAVYGRK